MKNNKAIAVVLGAGHGLGETLCQTFVEAGYAVVGINRSQNDTIISGCDMLQADLSNSNQAKSVLQSVLDKYGTPEIVVHNTAQLVIKPFLETTEDDYMQSLQSTSQTLFVAMQVLLPSMVEAGKGTVIVSGATASIRGGAKFSAFASAKFALRGLTQALAREFQPAGIHIAHVLLDGIIDTAKSRELHNLDPAKMMLPEDIASQYFALVNQPKSTWTHELDLRPSTEGF